MQRTITLVFTIAAVALAAAIAVKSAPTRADVIVPIDAGALVDAAFDAGMKDDALAPAPVDVPDLAAMIADTPPSAAKLPPGAPRQVRFGVILVSYQGAQGAPDHARSKGEAQSLATKLADDAKSDFKGAVARGDSGSADDAGSVPRGVLEPSAETVLFSLPVGGTSAAIDTPRGFWIVKRLE